MARKSRKKAITAHQKAARRKNMAIARAARKKGAAKLADKIASVQAKMFPGGKTSRSAIKKYSKKLSALEHGYNKLNPPRRRRYKKPPSSGYVHYD